MSNIFRTLIEKAGEITNTVGDKISNAVESIDKGFDDAASFIINTVDAVVAPQRQAKEMNTSTKSFQKEMFGETLNESFVGDTIKNNTVNDFIQTIGPTLDKELYQLGYDANNGILKSQEEVNERTKAILSMYKTEADSFGINGKENVSFGDLYKISDFSREYMGGIVDKSQPTLEYNYKDFFGQGEASASEGFADSIVNQSKDIIEDRYNDGLISKAEYSRSIYTRNKQMESAMRFQSYLADMESETNQIIDSYEGTDEYDEKKEQYEDYLDEKKEELRNYAALFISNTDSSGEKEAGEMYTERYGRSFLDDFSPRIGSGRGLLTGDLGGPLSGTRFEVYRSPLEYLRDERNIRLTVAKNSSVLDRVIGGTSSLFSIVNDVIDGAFDITSIDATELEKVSLRDARVLYQTDPSKRYIGAKIANFFGDTAPDILDLVINPTKYLKIGSKISKLSNVTTGSQRITNALLSQYKPGAINRIIKAVGAKDASKAITSLRGLTNPKAIDDVAHQLKLGAGQKLFATALSEGFYGRIAVDAKIQNMTSVEYTPTDAWLGFLSEAVAGGMVALKSMNRIYADTGSEIRRLIKESPDFRNNVGQDFWIRTGMDKKNSAAWKDLSAPVKKEFTESSIRMLEEGLGVREKVPATKKQSVAKVVKGKMDGDKQRNEAIPSEGVVVKSNGNTQAEEDRLNGVIDEMPSMDSSIDTEVKDELKEVFTGKGRDLGVPVKEEEIYYPKINTDKELMQETGVDKKTLKGIKEGVSQMLDDVNDGGQEIVFSIINSQNSKKLNEIANETNKLKQAKMIVDLMPAGSYGLLDIGKSPLVEQMKQRVRSLPQGSDIRKQNRTLLDNVELVSIKNAIEEKSRLGTANIPDQPAKKIMESPEPKSILKKSWEYINSKIKPQNKSSKIAFLETYKEYYGNPGETVSNFVMTGAKDLSQEELFYFVRYITNKAQGYEMDFDIKEVIKKRKYNKLEKEFIDSIPKDEEAYLEMSLKTLAEIFTQEYQQAAKVSIDSSTGERTYDYDQSILDRWKDKIGMQNILKDGEGEIRVNVKRMLSAFDGTKYVAKYGETIEDVININQFEIFYDKAKDIFPDMETDRIEKMYNYGRDVAKGEKEFIQNEYFESADDMFDMIGIYPDNLEEKLVKFKRKLRREFRDAKPELFGKSKSDKYLDEVVDKARGILKKYVVSKIRSGEVDLISIRNTIENFETEVLKDRWRDNIIKKMAIINQEGFTDAELLKLGDSSKVEEVYMKQLLMDQFNIVIDSVAFKDNVMYIEGKKVVGYNGKQVSDSFFDPRDGKLFVKKAINQPIKLAQQIAMNANTIMNSSRGIKLSIEKVTDEKELMKLANKDVYIVVDKDTYKYYQSQVVDKYGREGEEYDKYYPLFEKMILPDSNGVNYSDGRLLAESNSQLQSIVDKAADSLIKKGQSIADGVDDVVFSDGLKLSDEAKSVDTSLKEERNGAIANKRGLKTIMQNIRDIVKKYSVEDFDGSVEDIRDDYFMSNNSVGVGFQLANKALYTKTLEWLNTIPEKQLMDKVVKYFVRTGAVNDVGAGVDLKTIRRDVAHLIFAQDAYNATQGFIKKYQLDSIIESKSEGLIYQRLEKEFESIAFGNRLQKNGDYNIKSTAKSSYNKIRKMGEAETYEEAKKIGDMGSVWAKNQEYIKENIDRVYRELSDEDLNSANKRIEENVGTLDGLSKDGLKFEKDAVALVQSDPTAALEYLPFDMKAYFVIKDAVKRYNDITYTPKSSSMRIVNTGLLSSIAYGESILKGWNGKVYNNTAKKTGLSVFSPLTETVIDKNVGVDKIAGVYTNPKEGFPELIGDLNPEQELTDLIVQGLSIKGFNLPEKYNNRLGEAVLQNIHMQIINLANTMGVDEFKIKSPSLNITAGKKNWETDFENIVRENVKRNVESIFADVKGLRRRFKGLNGVETQSALLSQIVATGSVLAPRHKTIYLGDKKIIVGGLDRVTLDDVLEDMIDQYVNIEGATSRFKWDVGKLFNKTFDPERLRESLKKSMDLATDKQSKVDLLSFILTGIKENANSITTKTFELRGMPMYVSEMFDTFARKYDIPSEFTENVYNKTIAVKNGFDSRMHKRFISGQGKKEDVIEYINKYVYGGDRQQATTDLNRLFKDNEIESREEINDILSGAKTAKEFRIRMDGLLENSYSITHEGFKETFEREARKYGVDLDKGDVEELVNEVYTYEAISFNSYAVTRALEAFDPLALSNGETLQMKKIVSLYNDNKRVRELAKDYSEQTGISVYKLENMIMEYEHEFEMKNLQGDNSNEVGEFVDRADQKQFFNDNMSRLNNEKFMNPTRTELQVAIGGVKERGPEFFRSVLKGIEDSRKRILATRGGLSESEIIQKEKNAFIGKMIDANIIKNNSETKALKDFYDKITQVDPEGVEVNLKEQYIKERVLGGEKEAEIKPSIINAMGKILLSLAKREGLEKELLNDLKKAISKGDENFILRTTKIIRDKTGVKSKEGKPIEFTPRSFDEWKGEFIDTTEAEAKRSEILNNIIEEKATAKKLTEAGIVVRGEGEAKVWENSMRKYIDMKGKNKKLTRQVKEALIADGRKAGLDDEQINKTIEFIESESLYRNQISKSIKDSLDRRVKALEINSENYDSRIIKGDFSLDLDKKRDELSLLEYRKVEEISQEEGFNLSKEGALEDYVYMKMKDYIKTQAEKTPLNKVEMGKNNPAMNEFISKQEIIDANPC